MKILSEVRETKGLTQQEIAKKIGVAISTYNMYEKGNRSVPDAIADKIAIILGVKRDEIFSPTRFTVSKDVVLTKE